ncbi:MAG: antibiotic biosynthesis monooxygenase [Nitratireductor sp.]|nr:antibiotic biosynthesis monooxygenase [Nitratireductor sp.]
MFGQINKISVVPEKREEVIRLILSGSEGMPGCLSYVVAADEADENTVWVTEIWETSESHAASLNLPKVKAAIEAAMLMIKGFENVATTSPKIAG